MKDQVRDLIASMAPSTDIDGNLIDMVISRLSSLGYNPDDTAIEQYKIAHIMVGIEKDIHNMCNISNIPDGLKSVYTDMVCGKIILESYQLGKMPEGFTVDEALGTVKIGDISVSENGADLTNEQKLLKLCDYLIMHGKDDLVCYRRVKW